MKALLCLCFLFFICTVSFPFTESAPVYDLDGDELKPGTKYYVVSDVPGVAAGGLTLSAHSGGSCPITVSQDVPESNGLPVTFHPAKANGSIELSNSLSVQFEVSVTCARSTVWRIGRRDTTTGLQLIEIGGSKENPGCNTFRNWFRIENGPTLGSYKIVSNPVDICNTATESNNLAVAYALEKRPMVLSRDSQFSAVFIKYDQAIRIKTYVQ